jgi:hypothetical protein
MEKTMKRCQSPDPLVVFLPLSILAHLWAWAIWHWRLVLAMLVLVGCQSGNVPVSPPSTPIISSQATDAYRTVELLPERNRTDEAYIECQLRRADGQVVDERKWFQVLDSRPMQTAWVVDGGQAGPYAVYCRATHINGHYLYPFSTDESNPDGWQFVGGWYVPETHLFYLPIVWKGRG